MSSKKGSILKDMFPRVVAVAVIATAALMFTNHLNNQDIETWKEKVRIANTDALSAFDARLKEDLDTAAKLANDERLRPLFDEGFDVNNEAPKISRRAIYEFKYVNEIDHAYIFSTRTAEVVLKSAGSPDLPQNVINPFYNAAQEKLYHLTNITLIGGQSYILVAKAIYGPTGQILGYAIYTDSTQTFFNKVADNIDTQNLVYDAYMMKDGEAIAIENFAVTNSSLRIKTPGTTTWPIFKGPFEPEEISADGTIYIATGNHLKDISKWNITTAVDMAIVLAGSDKTKLMTFIAMIFSIIAVFLFPFAGPYSEALKSVYRKAGIMGEEPQDSAINLDDVNRMREEIEAENKQLEETAKKNAEVIKEQQKKDYKPSDAVIAYNIRTGMKNRRIKLLYQPVFATNDESVAMYEVYLRIIDDEGKVMPPSLWLPVARKEDLFSLIDETVVSVAVDKFFIRPNPLRISLAFNISGDTFSSLEFLRQLMDSSSSNYPIAEHTIFELRSREIIEDKRAMNFIKECREMGFRFSIDYFGGGPQTLKAAKTLKFDYAKIDVLQFNLDDKKDQTEFVKLVKTAEAIDLPLIIEKIEDERTLRFCKRIGVKFAQGYHLAEPSPDLATKRS